MNYRETSYKSFFDFHFLTCPLQVGHFQEEISIGTLKNDFHYREVSAIKYPLHRGFAILSVPQKSACCREVSAIQDVHYREVSLYLSRLLFHVTGDLRGHTDLSYPPLSSTPTTSLLLTFTPSAPYFNKVSEATIGILTFTIQRLYYLRDAMPRHA